MPTAIAIITRNRRPALERLLADLRRHCPGVPVSVVDDRSDRDDTPALLAVGERKARPELEGWACGPNLAGWSRLGVAGNTNRALRLLLESAADHFMILNDDVTVRGPAADSYAAAHARLGVGLMCGADPDDYECAWSSGASGGLRLKLLQRLPGAVMSVTRATVDRVGFFDPRFGKFGQEHVDFTHRCRSVGLMSIDGTDAYGVDLEENFMGRQAAPSSIEGGERLVCETEAEAVLKTAAVDYLFTDPYRPFSLVRSRLADRDGIATWGLGFSEVTSRVGPF